MSCRKPPFAPLRWALLALLVLGLCLQPVLAASCELGDALDGAATVQVDAAGDAADHVDNIDDGCCPSQACSDCCAHATASPQRPGIALPSSLRITPVVPPMRGFVARDYPVDIRPPIHV